MKDDIVGEKKPANVLLQSFSEPSDGGRGDGKIAAGRKFLRSYQTIGS